MTSWLAIDPGPAESAFVVVTPNLHPMQRGKVANEDLLHLIWNGWLAENRDVAIEMIGHYGTGMPAGKDVFDTCVWIGRFYEAVRVQACTESHLILRGEVKVHLCGSARAKDSNVTQALVDRFAPGQPNRGKGTKASPGFFHGFHTDIWQAFALAVYAADTAEDSWVAPTEVVGIVPPGYQDPT